MNSLPDLPPLNPKDVPQDANKRRAWIVVQLRARGLSLGSLSLRDGFSRNYFNQALYRPLFPAEVAIAEALGMTAAQLFPERFDRSGQRLHRVWSQSTRAARRSNGKGAEAA